MRGGVGGGARGGRRGGAGEDAELVVLENWSVSRAAVAGSDGGKVATATPVLAAGTSRNVLFWTNMNRVGCRPAGGMKSRVTSAPRVIWR